MKSTSDLFNEIIPLGRLIHMVNQKKDRLLNEYLSPLDITAAPTLRPAMRPSQGS